MTKKIKQNQNNTEEKSGENLKQEQEDINKNSESISEDITSTLTIHKSKLKRNGRILTFSALILSIATIIISVFVGIWHYIPFSQKYIAKYLSQKTNLNVEIGSIHTSWGNWKPRITIFNIKATDPKNKQKIWFSANNIDLLFGSYAKYGVNIPTANFTYIRLNNPYILSQQTKNGWSIFDQKPSKEPLESLPNWLFEQDLIEINNAKIDLLSIKGDHLPIDFRLSLKKHNHTHNYLSYLDVKLPGINADIKAFFSPIYKKAEFLGYFKEWVGRNSVNLNVDLSNENIQYYKNFLIGAKNHNSDNSNSQEIIQVKNQVKIDDILTNIKQIQGSIQSKLIWKQTTIEKGSIDIDFTNIDGKLPNALQKLMSNLNAHIKLNSINNNKSGSVKTSYTIQQQAFIKKYSKGLPNQNYIWNIDYVNWNNSDKNDNKPNNRSEIRNIIISHPTHSIFPISFSLKNSDLSPFNNIFNKSLIPTKYQQFLSYINPRANINNLQFIYTPDKSIHKLLQYTINADIENIQFNYPYPANIESSGKNNTNTNNISDKNLSMLGKNGLNLKLQGSFEKGSSQITAKDIIFKLPSIKQTLPLNLVDTNLAWNIDEQINIDVPKILIQNNDIKFDAKASYIKQENNKSNFITKGNFSAQNINVLHKFLPDSLEEKTKQIIQSMNIDGIVNNAKFDISGNPEQFKNNFDGIKFNLRLPLQNAKFSIPHVNHEDKSNSDNQAQAKLISLPLKQEVRNNKSQETMQQHISSNWPRFENINGNLNIINKQMQINIDNASAGNLKIGKTGILLNSFTNNPILTVNAESNGSLDSMLNYVNVSPVHEWIGSLNFKTTGDANLKLNLAIPLHDLHASTVHGSVDMNDNDIEFIPSIPVFKHVKSLINFDHKGFKFDQASANFIGENIIAGGYSKEHAVYITANGILSKNGMEGTDFKSVLSRIPKYIQGQTPYTANLSIVNKEIKVDVDTNLNGISIALPEPLNKNANENKPMHFSWHLMNQEKPIEKIKLNYNNLVGAVIEQQRENGEAKNIRGIYYADHSFSEDLPLPEEGIQAKVNLKYINADAWRNFYNNLQKDLNNDKQKIYSVQESAAKGEAELYLPARIAAYTQSLRAMDREIKNIILGISRQDDGWSGNISSSHINGFIRLHPASSKNINGLIEGHFSQVNIPDKQQKQIIAELFQERVQDLPALNIKIDNFTMLQKPLGKVNINAYNDYNENKKTWHIKNISLENNDANLSAKGFWDYSVNKTKTSNNINSQTNIEINLELKDVGNFLNLLGATQVVKNGKGIINANLEWQGSPLEFNYPTLNSNVKLNIKDGVILKVDPAAAKLLGIVSLQGLGNILTFNWNKLFAQGSPFDEINSDALIKNGILNTDNFNLNSPQAKVTLKGNLDLKNETQNLQADIYPKINAGSASIAYSIINPAIGLGTLIAQVALANPLSKILKQSYAVTGKWDKPSVKKITHNDENETSDKESFSK